MPEEETVKMQNCLANAALRRVAHRPVHVVKVRVNFDAEEPKQAQCKPMRRARIDYGVGRMKPYRAHQQRKRIAQLDIVIHQPCNRTSCHTWTILDAVLAVDDAIRSRKGRNSPESNPMP